mmetsp:Transcript_2571/g.3973  ORF Transcript_2571/g.3973 Transcript_2571/m.3973 type:complete len:113 (-) Transcript_2571:194-532(-)
MAAIIGSKRYSNSRGSTHQSGPRKKKSSKGPPAFINVNINKIELNLSPQMKCDINCPKQHQTSGNSRISKLQKKTRQLELASNLKDKAEGAELVGGSRPRIMRKSLFLNHKN